MLKKAIKTQAIAAFLLLFMAFFAAMPAVFAGYNEEKYGLGDTAKQVKAFEGKSPSSVPTLVGSVISPILGFIGLLFFLLIIYAGFNWMTAGGNDEKVKKSIDLIMQAVVGLVIVASAYLITKFVGDAIISNLG
jgi:ABC-type amino acid transport system permease subunit